MFHHNLNVVIAGGPRQGLFAGWYKAIKFPKFELSGEHNHLVLLPKLMFHVGGGLRTPRCIQSLRIGDKMSAISKTLKTSM